MEFGKNLKKLRMERGMSQKELAVCAGVSDSAISSYEQRGKLPQLDAAVAIADALGVSLDTLVTGREAAKSASANAVFATYAGLAKAILLAGNEFGIHIRASGDFGESLTIELYQSSLKEFVERLDQLRKLQKQDVLGQDVIDAWLEKSLRQFAQMPLKGAPDVVQWLDALDGSDPQPKNGKLTRIIEESPDV